MISALMKKFVERTSYISHRPIFFGKYATALATCAGFGAELTCKYLVENFTQSGFNFVSSVELMIATKSETETNHNRMKAINEYEKLIEAIKSHGNFKPSLGQLVYFNIFKSISELNKTKGWADYNFYKDKKDFYHDIKIHFLKNKMAKWIAGREVKKLMANK
jgi:multimeric flavodoxin WrbA